VAPEAARVAVAAAPGEIRVGASSPAPRLLPLRGRAGRNADADGPLRKPLLVPQTLLGGRRRVEGRGRAGAMRREGGEGEE
jgi:hypothetical protein